MRFRQLIVISICDVGITAPIWLKPGGAAAILLIPSQMRPKLSPLFQFNKCPLSLSTVVAPTISQKTENISKRCCHKVGDINNTWWARVDFQLKQFTHNSLLKMNDTSAFLCRVSFYWIGDSSRRFFIRLHCAIILRPNHILAQFPKHFINRQQLGFNWFGWRHSFACRHRDDNLCLE